MIGLIKPEEISIKSSSGEIVKYTISRLPATKGFKIIAKLPKFYKDEMCSEIMEDIMFYVATSNGIRLTSSDLIDNHVDSWEDILKILKVMVEYNQSFFTKDETSAVLSGLVQSMKLLTSQTLMEQLRSLLSKNLQHSMNSEPSMM